jgi:hypothetical protein
VDRFNFFGSLHPPIFYINGKIRTQQGAQAAVDASAATMGGHAAGRGHIGMHLRIRLHYFRGVIALGIGTLRHDKDILGAKLNTVAASLASFLYDVDDAVRYEDPVSVQGLSPIGHNPSLRASVKQLSDSVRQHTTLRNLCRTEPVPR